jgi:transposase
MVSRARIILAVADGQTIAAAARLGGCGRRIAGKGAQRFRLKRMVGLADEPRSGRPPVFPPSGGHASGQAACELPDQAERSLSVWTCGELARTLRQEGLVETISPQSVQRILSSYRLKPWRVHHWLSGKTPRDEEFRRRTNNVCDLYTRELESHERVLCVDEKTSLQPRPRTSATLPAKPGLPIRLEHEYRRRGALQLLAALDTRSGAVTGICRKRKRQEEFIELLEVMDCDTPSSVTLVHVVCDNLILHKGKKVQAWLAQHPRFRFHFTPVHCSWMNQIEQWFSILSGNDSPLRTSPASRSLSAASSTSSPNGTTRRIRSDGRKPPLRRFSAQPTRRFQQPRDTRRTLTSGELY